LGAELICHICKGPEEISAELRAAAIEEVSRFQELATTALGHFELLGGDGDPDAETEACACEYVRAWRKHGPPELLAAAVELYGEPDQENWRALVGEAPETLVSRFLGWWRSCSVRDTAARTDPDMPGQKIVVCGETTSGTEPEGEGFGHMKVATATGMLTPLGIR